MPQVPPQTRPPQFGAHHQQYVPNGSVPGMPPQPVQLPPQKVIEKAGVRILCIADVRGMNSDLLCYVDFGHLRLFGCDISRRLTLKIVIYFFAGNLRSLNELAKKANADHILHTGDFGFYDDSSLERIADKLDFNPNTE